MLDGWYKNTFGAFRRMIVASSARVLLLPSISSDGGKPRMVTNGGDASVSTERNYECVDFRQAGQSGPRAST